ncbi:MAG: tyrosine-type recombinase/integrase [Candidatus Aenigmarchaeota archaeon]|nr:tyrosine-type recombinase/integrase [Candidatus Aenigmarchaeota archaeon]
MPDEKEEFERRLARLHKQLRASKEYPENKRAILKFSDFCFSEGLGIRRVIKYIYTLRAIDNQLGKDFRRCNREDIQELVRKIERSDYSDWTKHDVRVTLKKFFRWLRGTEEYPHEVRWIKTGFTNRHRKLPEELLTQEEIHAMIAAAMSTRDRAFIAMLYESGCRIGEVLGMQIRHINQHPHGFQISVNGKTGPRRLLLIACAQYVTDWLNEHPRRRNPAAPLWITSHSNVNRIAYTQAHTILKNAARRAQIEKSVNPHNFRHSRATHLATCLTEAQMNEYFGWVQGSDMASTYVHLSGRDIDNALLKMHNKPIPKEDESNNKFTIMDCPRCKHSNPPGHRFCSRCGTVLDEETANAIVQKELDRKKADEMMDRLIQDQEFREVLKRKLAQL